MLSVIGYKLSLYCVCKVGKYAEVSMHAFFRSGLQQPFHVYAASGREPQVQGHRGNVKHVAPLSESHRDYEVIGLQMHQRCNILHTCRFIFCT